MTFFANSGIKFGGFANATSEAGQATLSVASDFWRVLAQMEGKQEDVRIDRQETEFGNIVSGLRNAASSYRKIAEKMSDEPTYWLTPSEAEFASVDYRQRLFFDHFVFGPERWTSVKSLYEELARRLDFLGEEISGIDPTKDGVKIAPAIFNVMFRWQQIMELGRIIAVINRRDLPRKLERSR